MRCPCCHEDQETDDPTAILVENYTNESGCAGRMIDRRTGIVVHECERERHWQVEWRDSMYRGERTEVVHPPLDATVGDIEYTNEDS